MNNQDYFQTDNIQLNNFEPNQITEKYNQGYVFTRTAKGNMIQTRSLRIDLSLFELSSENRRILNKNENLGLMFVDLPLADYSWEIHSLGKEFYSKKFGDGTMSAAKIKELFQEPEKSNMNSVFKFKLFKETGEYQPNSYMEVMTGKNYAPLINKIEDDAAAPTGYCLTYSNAEIIHYAYPFYNLEIPKEQNLGIGMMTKAILWAKENKKRYIYLGSIVKPSSKYKLQFSGLEWFDTEKKEWSSDLEKVKELITSAKEQFAN